MGQPKNEQNQNLIRRHGKTSNWQQLSKKNAWNPFNITPYKCAALPFANASS